MATIILKATEKCNCNCYYCDVVRKQNTGHSMPREVLDTTFLRVDEYLQENPQEKIEILWHGGEPLVLGVNYYKDALKMQNQHCKQTKDRISHSIQTNLTCFREDFVEVLRGLGINSIGTSYDPEPNIRGIGKKNNSDLYNKKFMKSLEILDKHGIGWGMIYVVTKRSLLNPLKVYYFLTNLTLTGAFNMNPVLIYDSGRKDIAIDAKEYVDFLGTLFPVWWEQRERFPQVQPFKSLIDTIINNQLSLGCVDSGDCAYHHINIAPDGETSQCGRSADWGLLQYGNIKEKSLTEILHDSQRAELKSRSDVLQHSECKGCRFWHLCHGGCPLDSYSVTKSFMHKSEWCEAKWRFIEDYFEPITGVRYDPAQGAAQAIMH